MNFKKFLLISLLFCMSTAYANDANKAARSVVGANSFEKFSFHRPTYFIFGDDDLKIQYSFKYRLAKSIPLYLAYSQLMFWKIYKESKPFEDVNYSPEVFYRLIDKENTSFRTLDMGWIHLSNGNDELDTRSLDRIFLRGNYLTTLRRNNLNFNLLLHYIYNEDDTNKDIVNHLGYWDLTTHLTDVLIFDSGRLGIEIRAYAGSKVIDLDQGALQTGLIYQFESKNFNPSLYLQRFEGYSESLLKYNRRHTEYRLGIMLTF